MGTWGVGLYSNDFAADLRAAVSSIARLPLDPDQALKCLCDQNAVAARDDTDDEHSTFWLVVAEQFAKRGIDCPEARERAVALIRDGVDINRMRRRGMDEKLLTKRSLMLSSLHDQISQAPKQATRSARLRKPQTLILEVGDLVAYPTCSGCPINPYMVTKQGNRDKNWVQNGWGAFVVADRGLLFGFLAWYWPLIVSDVSSTKPTFPELVKSRSWRSANVGTLSRQHYQSLKLEPIGSVSFNPAKFASIFGNCCSPAVAAINDISICNSLTLVDFAFQDQAMRKIGYAVPRRVNALEEVMSFPQRGCG